MKLSFIDKSLVHSNKTSEKGNELVIKRKHPSEKRDVKLSDVLKFLPRGIIYKDETGMGATHLELIAPRNSIIVEPIKITASSKAFTSDALYVGSSTQYHPKNKVSDTDIQAYITEPLIPFKKIVVVADSLSRVMDILLTECKGLLHDWYFLVDEVDTFQMDSTYRQSMEKCLDYYDCFLPTNRILLSATSIEFSNPILLKEPITFVSYDKPAKRNILIKTAEIPDLQSVSVDTIKEVLKKHPGDKVFVAYNSVKGCISLAEHLLKAKVIQRSEIFIYCSVNSKDSATPYYAELESDKLKGKVNFFTSAYFSGFDLTESYHLVSISGNRGAIYALSEKKLKQIAGRCRTKLLSETVVHDTYTGELKDYHTKESLLEAANAEVSAFQCMHKHYTSDPILETLLSGISDGFLKVLEDKRFRLVRKNIDNGYQISYLNIDAILEQQRVRVDLYMNNDSLAGALKNEGHHIETKYCKSKTKVENKAKSTEQRDEDVKKIVDVLKEFKYNIEIDDYMNAEKLSTPQKTLALAYRKVIEFLEPASTLDILKKCITGKRNMRQFNRVAMSAYIQTLPDDHFIKARFIHYFTIGKRYTSEEVELRIGLFLQETGLPFNANTKNKAVQVLGLFSKYYTKTHEDGIMRYTISNYNPFNFTVLAQRKSMKNDTVIDTLKSYF